MKKKTYRCGMNVDVHLSWQNLKTWECVARKRKMDRTVGNNQLRMRERFVQMWCVSIRWRFCQKIIDEPTHMSPFEDLKTMIKNQFAFWKSFEICVDPVRVFANQSQMNLRLHRGIVAMPNVAQNYTRTFSCIHNHSKILFVWILQTIFCADSISWQYTENDMQIRCKDAQQRTSVAPWPSKL